jgi:hypothetical protein
MSLWGNKWMTEWLEALGRITLLARESVASLLTFLAAVVVGCHTADGAAPPPANRNHSPCAPATAGAIAR